MKSRGQRDVMAHEVLHILGTARPEGSSLARFVRDLARELDPRRYRTRALFLAGEGPLAGALDRAGVPAEVLDWWRGARDPGGAWRFWRHLRRLHVDILQVHFGGRSVRGLARAATGAKLIVHVHSRVLEPEGLAPVSISVRGADAAVAVSQAVADRVVDGNARVIYAGADPASGPAPAWAHGSRSEVIIGAASRLIPLKGLTHLLSAAAALQGEFPGLRIEIAGAGPERRHLEEAVARLGLAARVQFLGWVDDLPAVLPRWDVFALPSLEEGFPVVALDAMAAGLPVVASAVGGIPELVADGKTGWLVPPADTGALVARLRDLLLRPEQRLTMGAAAQARVREHFSVARMAQGFAGLYDELLHELPERASRGKER
jgi:glycosyltransferase involved in cell wall biosynthesis